MHQAAKPAMTEMSTDLPKAAEGRVTLWKLQILVASFAFVFALLYWLFGPFGGFLMLILLPPLCSVVLWLFLSDHQADRLMTMLAIPPFLFVLYFVATLPRGANLGISILTSKGLLAVASLYCWGGLSLGRSLARCLRSWEG
jgi:hypothetical protein